MSDLQFGINKRRPAREIFATKDPLQKYVTINPFTGEQEVMYFSLSKPYVVQEGKRFVVYCAANDSKQAKLLTEAYNAILIAEGSRPAVMAALGLDPVTDELPVEQLVKELQ